MNAHVQSVHQQVIEKTKGLAFRSQVLSNNIEKRASARKSGPEWVRVSQNAYMDLFLIFLRRGVDRIIFEKRQVHAKYCSESLYSKQRAMTTAFLT